MDPLLRGIVILSAQWLVIVAAAAVAEALASRSAGPRFRLRYWRAVALACLALPLAAFVPAAAPGAGLLSFAMAIEAGAATPGPAILPAVSLALWLLLGGGALARVSWLCAGALRLRHLRHRSRVAILTSDLEAIRAAVAPWAEVRVSSAITQPASFGLRRPVVLLPDRFFALTPQAQQAVACHELLHVARRDWPWIVVEELARAVLWFHPAVWWIVERIQVSREQLVDRLVVARLPWKRAYMAALLAFADGSRRPVTPATAFLRRRDLRSRMRELARESVMSQRRMVWTAVVVAGVIAGTIAGTVLALPLNADSSAAVQAQEVLDSQAFGVTLPRVVSEVKPRYTAEAMRARIEGTVIMTAVIRTDGTPGDIVVTKSLDAEYGLDREAAAALAQWRFEPGRKDEKPVPVLVTIEMHFTLKK
jgi:TonB family protein